VEQGRFEVPEQCPGAGTEQAGKTSQGNPIAALPQDGQVLLLGRGQTVAVIAQGGQGAFDGRAIEQGEGAQIETDRACARSAVQREREGALGHGLVEGLEHGSRYRMDLVEEEHVPLTQACEQTGQGVGVLKHAATRGVQAGAEACRDAMGERGLAGAGRPDEEGVREAASVRPAAGGGRLEAAQERPLADEPSECVVRGCLAADVEVTLRQVLEPEELGPGDVASARPVLALDVDVASLFEGLA